MPWFSARARPIGTLGAGIVLATLLGGCWGKTPTDPSCVVASVTVDPGQLNLVIGGATGTLTATLVTSGCTTPPAITWTSSSSASVTISGSGSSITVAAAAASVTPVTITATAAGVSGTAQVTVLTVPAIALSPAAVTIIGAVNGTPTATRTVTVSNAGAGTLTGLTVGTITYGSGATGWLQASLNSGTASPTATLTLLATLGALSEGTYTATVPILAAGASNSPLSLVVTFTVLPESTSGSILVFERWTGATYPSASGEIWSMDPNGLNQVRLTDNLTFDGYPALSPDRTRISFSTNRAGNLDLYVMNVDGTGQTGVRFTASPEVQSTWSPDGLRLAYELIFANADVDILLYTLGNQVLVPLVETPQSEENPTWSPDGLQVAFAKDPLGTGAYQIFRAPVAGGTPTQLTSDTNDNFSPAWSPDGAKIVFSSNRGGTYQLYVMDAATGANLVQLTTTGTNFQPSWSPDGTRIAYASGQNNDWDIWVMNADGTNKVNITATPATNEISPSWR